MNIPLREGHRRETKAIMEELGGERPRLMKLQKCCCSVASVLLLALVLDVVLLVGGKEKGRGHL